ncbi:DUF305 domain-containing protein [Williamsia phyllosphaerae]|uniref:DUF305 domain-containing protein n=1 Tax=Williamsia phyllosphaerae TaxID=885042 RepID=A0ABQ1U9M4_9NOCA|nr:DUF305 domain-containing protein [Williamsia phyllosphaerae]GGF12476.1 DUF305 domain-containing protein [Williamsia phyllosphaerae]
MSQRWALCIVALTAGVSMIVGVMIGNAGSESAPALSSVDVGFAQDMLAHHQQAITIVGQLSPQATPDVRAVADQISGTQLAETGQMRGWLQAAGEPEQSPTPMAWMGSDHAEHAGSAMMPGMADDAELTALHETTGVDNEIRFLQLMIRHHQGGISMAQYLRQHGHNGSVTATATQMQDEQSNEVDLMVTLLTARGGTPLPFA